MDTTLEQVQFEFGFACDIGRKRKGEPNQDAVEIVLPNAGERWHPPLLLVADGLGRYFGGSIASQLVIKTFKEAYKQAQHPTNYLLVMEKCAQAAHTAIRSQGATDPKLALMGSTIVAATLQAQRLYLLNIGDSRAYIFRDKNILQISQDQSWVAAQVRAGVLTKEEARTHPNRNRLIMAITAKRTEIKSYTTEEKLESNDIILLCSDGLWGVVPETLIRAAAVELPPQVAADKLISLANNSKGPDNISVIIARPSGFNKKEVSINLEDTSP